MATVNLGNIKFNWKGAYNGSTAYVVDDVVSNSGSSYICIQASTGNAPTNTTYAASELANTFEPVPKVVPVAV